jgi:hypothetical protein
MRLRRNIGAGVVALAIIGTGVGVGTTKALAAAPSCSSTSPVLGIYTQYFTFNGVTNGAEYIAEARGVWSKSNPAADCIWGETVYIGEKGQVLYSLNANYPAMVNISFYYSPSYGKWDELNSWPYYYPAGFWFSQMYQSGVLVKGTQSFSQDCIVLNAEDQYGYNGGPSRFYNLNGYLYIAGQTMPGNNTSLICPK